jgi:hypothetical protein
LHWVGDDPVTKLTLGISGLFVKHVVPHFSEPTIHQAQLATLLQKAGPSSPLKPDDAIVYAFSCVSSSPVIVPIRSALVQGGVLLGKGLAEYWLSVPGAGAVLGAIRAARAEVILPIAGQSCLLLTPS